MSRLGKISFSFAVVMLLGFAISRSLVAGWIPFFWILLGLFAFFVGFGLWADRKFFAEFLTLKTTKHGMNMGVLIVGFLGLVIFVNILSARHYKTWDFSLSRINSLSDQSEKILRSLDSELLIAYLYKKSAKDYEINRKMFTDTIRKYQDASDKVKLEFYDPEERPDVAEKYQFKGDQAVFLDYKGKTNRVDKIDEQSITSGLVKVTRTKSKTVYFTAGHGEPELDVSDKSDGAGVLRQLLESNNYTVKSLNLSAVGKMPEDIDVIFILGPQYPFQKLEIQALQNYARIGGSIFAAINFPDKSGLAPFLASAGVQVLPQFTLNILASVGGPIIDPNEATRASRFSTTHSITRVFAKNDSMIMTHPMALKKSSPAPEGMVIDELVTVPQAVSFPDLTMKNQGPVADYVVAMAARGAAPEGKDKTFNLVVVGDAHFAENNMIGAYVNRDLILNTVALLAREENLISISPKEPPGSKLDLTTVKEAAMFWGFFVPVPLIFLVLSLYFWFRRRHA